MLDIAVVVVNWNAKDDLRMCLTSLYAEALTQASCAVWVVDNASTDGSPQMVHDEFPQAALIENSSNLGFSKANNQAIARSESRYVFLLNSDAFIHAGTLEGLIAFADAHPEAGVVGPKVFNPDGSLQLSCRRFPSLGAGFFRNTYLGRLFPRNKYAQNYLMTDFDHAQTRAVDWVSGCAMLLRREMTDRIGGLDEHFYMYCEDVDICRRAWQSGSSVYYLPDACVTHAIGRSSDKDADRMIWEFHRAWFTYDKKWHPKSGLLRRALVWGGLWLRARVRVFNRHRALGRAAKRTAADQSAGRHDAP